MKANITLNDELMKRVDDYAKDNYTTRSGLISIACTQYLNAQESFGAIKQMALAMQTIADKGEIDEETQRQLDDFQRFSKLVLGTR